MEEEINLHEEMLLLAKPLIDFMDKNNFNYVFITGKDGTCARYIRGNHDDLVGITTPMICKSKEYKNIILESIKDSEEFKEAEQMEIFTSSPD